MAAIDITQLKNDLDKLSDNDLQDLRNRVDASLIVSPEDDLADLAVLRVMQAFRANRDAFVQVSLANRTGPDFTINVTTSLTLTTSFILIRRWLFIYFNKRKD